MTEEVPEGSTPGFVSYTRKDNDDFHNVVDRLRDDLSAMYEAKTGKTLNFFLDRESIGWGEDWRQKIYDSIDAATVFIPIITMRYFTSSMCVEELTTFHSATERLGVTELILPIVLFGSDQISENDPRPAVSLIAKLNHKKAEEPWSAGYNSSEWKRFIAECVRDLDSAIQAAEAAIATRLQDLASRRGDSARKDGPGAIVDRSGGGETDGSSKENLTADVDLDEMQTKMALVKPLAERALSELEDIGSIMSTLDVEGVSRQVANVRTIKIANDLRGPSEEIERTGREMADLMQGLDAQVRGLVSELADIDLPFAQEQLAELLNSFETDGDLIAVETEVEEAIKMLRLISLMNVALKRSLQPAGRGFRSIKTAVSVFRGWQQLREEFGNL